MSRWTQHRTPSKGRKDASQGEIEKALDAVGATWVDTSRVGNGFPDLVVGYRGVTYQLEVKAHKVPGMSRNSYELRPGQVDWHNWWAGHKAVVRDRMEALRAIGATR